MTIYNPISIRNNESEANEEITDNFENELFIKNDIIISIGRLSHQKNQSLMLDVFAQVEKRNPRLRLVILGGGDLRGALEEKIKKLKLTEKVFLLGVKQNVYKYLKKSKFFLFTSSFEGLGMVLLEAMSLGIPVVVLQKLLVVLSPICLMMLVF
jgi:glycosyltransferase involved in cell wall biosynthesis